MRPQLTCEINRAKSQGQTVAQMLIQKDFNAIVNKNCEEQDLHQSHQLLNLSSFFAFPGKLFSFLGRCKEEGQPRPLSCREAGQAEQISSQPHQALSLPSLSGAWAEES